MKATVVGCKMDVDEMTTIYTPMGKVSLSSLNNTEPWVEDYLILGNCWSLNKRMLCYHLLSYSADGDVQWHGFKARMAAMQSLQVKCLVGFVLLMLKTWASPVIYSTY